MKALAVATGDALLSNQRQSIRSKLTMSGWSTQGMRVHHFQSLPRQDYDERSDSPIWVQVRATSVAGCGELSTNAQSGPHTVSLVFNGVVFPSLALNNFFRTVSSESRSSMAQARLI